MSTILITGGAGFVGSQLGYALHKHGHKVILVDDLSFGKEDNLVVDGERFGTFIKDDIRNKSLFEHCKGVDYVFHFAAIAPLPNCQEDPYACMDINVAGTANVFEAARRNGVKRVVFASTSAIYENNTDFPCKETDPVSPDLIYATSKLNCENLARAFGKPYGLEIVCLRFHNVYGPHQDFRRKHPPFTGYVIREFMLGRAPILHSTGHQKRDYVYVDDVVAMCELVLTHPKARGGEIFNIASGKAISVREIVDFIRNNFKAEGQELKEEQEPVYREAGLFWDKYPQLFEGAYPLNKERLEKEVTKYSCGSVDKAKEVLGFECKVGFEEGFRRTVAYSLKMGLDQEVIKELLVGG